jgi:hypothetical protein
MDPEYYLLAPRLLELVSDDLTFLSEKVLDF